MKKPQSKTEVKILSYKEGKEIRFYASSKALDDIKDFGAIQGMPTGVRILIVDQRYDFTEVLEYLRHYG